MAAVSVVNQSQVGRELTRWTARVISITLGVTESSRSVHAL